LDLHQRAGSRDAENLLNGFAPHAVAIVREVKRALRFGKAPIGLGEM
jgi:hypothetical protein